MCVLARPDLLAEVFVFARRPTDIDERRLVAFIIVHIII